MNKWKLRELLSEKGKTLGWLAEELGICRQALSNKVNGRTPITTNEVIRIQELMDLSDAQRDEVFFSRP